MEQDELTIRERAFEAWKRHAPPGSVYRYHHGEFGADRRQDPELELLADRLLKASNGDFDVVSGCGHIRDHIDGAGEVELLQRPDGGQRSYLARRLR